ncbi:hypothetical protein [Rhodococcus sp. 27YEA15]|uniref:hypothetical protein n=1 Tax=Rhodococcus sp. 27YEA15 TaxID=3156259 RepID=UPI003C7A1F2D
MLTKRLYEQHPPRYDYVATESGNASYLILIALMNWGDSLRNHRSATHRPRTSLQCNVTYRGNLRARQGTTVGARLDRRPHRARATVGQRGGGNPPVAIGPHESTVTRRRLFPCLRIAARYSSQSG